MEGLKNPRHEAFCLYYIETGNATESYARAYNRKNDKTSEANGSALLKRTEVQLRLAKVRKAHAETHGVTVASITAELEEARTAALDAGQYAAAINAIVHKAKMHGVYVEKTDNTHRHVMSAEDLSEDELLRIATGSGAGDSASSAGAQGAHKVH